MRVGRLTWDLAQAGLVLERVDCVEAHGLDVILSAPPVGDSVVVKIVENAALDHGELLLWIAATDRASARERWAPVSVYEKQPEPTQD